MTVKIIQGDARSTGLAARSVHMIATSPPYWGLRAYLKKDDPAKASEIGAESTPDAYVESMREVGRECYRVLRDDGVMWINLGDTYSNGGGAQSFRNQPNANRDGTADTKAQREPIHREGGLPSGNLVGIPWRVAFALQEPDHIGPIRRKEDRAWLAALIDGEGTIGIKRDKGRGNGQSGVAQDGFSVYISIGNQNKALLDRCVEITGYSTVGVKDRPSEDKRGIKMNRTYYGWWCSSNMAVAVLQDVYPYLIAKRRQAALAYTLSLSNHAGKSMRGKSALPSDEQARRELLKALCNACNQWQPVDIPDWVQEPPANIGPPWILRAAIPWIKFNAMPESVKNRPTVAHEYVFLFAKRAGYFYDADAVRAGISASTVERFGENATRIRPNGCPTQQSTIGFRGESTCGVNPAGRNIRTSDFMNASLDEYEAHIKRVRAEGGLFLSPEGEPLTFLVNPVPNSLGHFAMWPPKLVAPMILAGTSERGCCPMCGAQWRRSKRVVSSWRDDACKTPQAYGPGSGNRRARSSSGGMSQSKYFDEGFSPSCSCPEHEPIPSTVFDPFGGTGTTAQVAEALGRDSVLCELNEAYHPLIRQRLAERLNPADWKAVPKAPAEQGSLW